jgi:predicted nucleic-acid-binding protein
MIGIDTNVLLRLFTEDNPRQTSASTAALLAQEPGSVRVSIIVLTELVWTLGRYYKIPKSDVIAIAESLLSREELIIECRGEVLGALEIYRGSKADFGDCFIAVLNQAAGAVPTLTFDRNAAESLRLFQLVGEERKI